MCFIFISSMSGTENSFMDLLIDIEEKPSPPKRIKPTPILPDDIMMQNQFVRITTMDRARAPKRVNRTRRPQRKFTHTMSTDLKKSIEIMKRRWKTKVTRWDVIGYWLGLMWKRGDIDGEMCAQRYRRVIKNSTEPWTPEEEDRLTRMILRHVKNTGSEKGAKWAFFSRQLKKMGLPKRSDIFLRNQWIKGLHHRFDPVKSQKATMIMLENN